MRMRGTNNKLFIVALTLAVILCSGHALQTIETDLQYIMLLTAAFMMLPILFTVKASGLNVYMGSLILLLLMIFATATVHFGSGLVYYLLLACTIITAFGITLIYPFGKVVSLFLKIMTFSTVVALVGYVLVNTSDFLDFLPEYQNVNNAYYSVGVVFNYLTYAKIRNCGMFWEPGIFATYLILAFVFEVIFKPGKPSKFRLILFSVGIITANSSAGFLLWVLCVVLLFTNSAKNKRTSSVVSLVVIVGTLFVFTNFDAIIVSLGLDQNEFVRKLLSDNFMNSSRVLAIEHNLKMFSKAPIFGMGIISAAQSVKYVADTSTSTYMLSIFGLPAVLYTGYWIYGVIKIKNINILSKIIVMCILMAIINKEPHMQMAFTWCLLFYLIKNTLCEPNTIPKDT